MLTLYFYLQYIQFITLRTCYLRSLNKCLTASDDEIICAEYFFFLFHCGWHTRSLAKVHINVLSASNEISLTAILISSQYSYIRYQDQYIFISIKKVFLSLWPRALLVSDHRIIGYQRREDKCLGYYRTVAGDDEQDFIGYSNWNIKYCFPVWERWNCGLEKTC